MKVLLKTSAQLLADGWKQSVGGDYSRKYLWYGTRPDPEMAIGYYDATYLLGRTVEVIETDFECTIPRIKVRDGSRKAWFALPVLSESFHHKSFRLVKHEAKIGGKKFKFYPQFKRFEFGCEEWEIAEATKAARWVLKHAVIKAKK